MNVVRQLVYWLLIPLICPLVWATKFAVRHSRRPRVWYEFFAEALSLVPFDLGILVRRMFYERTLERCGRNLCVRLGAIISYPDTRVGDNVLLNRYSIVGLADIGHNVMIANHCSLLSGRYHHKAKLVDVPMREQGAEIQRVYVGDDVWIGANAVVMADIGAGSVIGAGAVVVHEIPPYSVAVGNPAEVIKVRGQANS